MLVGVERYLVVIRKPAELVADADQAVGVMRGITVQLELEIACAGVFVPVGNAALAFDFVVEADGVPDGNPLQPLATLKELRDVTVAEIARQACIDTGDVLRHAVEEIRAGCARHRVEDRLVDLGQPVRRRQRRNVLSRAQFELGCDAGSVQSEGRIEVLVRQIKLARDQQRAAQFLDRLLRRQMRPLVEPLRHEKFGARTDGPGLAFDLDLDQHKSLRRRVDDNGAEPERPREADRPLKESNIAHG